MEKDGQKSTYKTIQLLRALAACFVAYYHSTGRGGVNLLPRVGAFGVDIFFVISGFIIAFITFRKTEHFLINRIFRIVPLYIIATIIMVLAYLAFPEKINKVVVTVPAFIKSILFIPYKIETKFEPTGPILEPGWTLNYEMFFYMIMAVCILPIKNKKYSGILCASLLTVIFAFLNIINSKNFYFAYYQKSLIPEFICGTILYYIYNFFTMKNKGYFLIRNSALNITVFSFAGIVCLSWMIGDAAFNWHGTTGRNIYGGIPALLLVFSFLNLEKEIKNNLFITICLKIGDASYALYLFHLFIGTFFTRILFSKMILHNDSIFKSVMIELVIMSSTIILSIIIYVVIDKPIQDFLKKTLKNRAG